MLILFAGAAAQAQAQAQAQAPTGAAAFATSAEVKAQVASMLAAMKPGQGFAWKPLVSTGDTAAAVEIWKKPGKPAVHPAQAEYAIVLEGRGTLISGGTLVDAKESNPTLTEGSRIEGGTTRPLAPGDVILVPAGAPHWFGVEGERLVLLGTKIAAGN
jgi:mannose-6-phosphate isomerase-like protein (cupin superfamily)